MTYSSAPLSIFLILSKTNFLDFFFFYLGRICHYSMTLTPQGRSGVMGSRTGGYLNLLIGLFIVFLWFPQVTIRCKFHFDVCFVYKDMQILCLQHPPAFICLNTETASCSRSIPLKLRLYPVHQFAVLLFRMA